MFVEIKVQKMQVDDKKMEYFFYDQDYLLQNSPTSKQINFNGKIQLIYLMNKKINSYLLGELRAPSDHLLSVLPFEPFNIPRLLTNQYQ